MIKKTLPAIITMLLTLACFANVEVFKNAWLKGSTDKSPVSYQIGETMVFTIEPKGIRGKIPAGKYFLKWVRSGDDGVEEKGLEPFTRKPFIYKTCIAKSGFVRLYAAVVDEKGKVINKKGGVFTPDLFDSKYPQTVKLLKRMKEFVFFDGGAGAGVDTLRQAVAEPKDFDAFWAKQKSELAKVPFNVKRIERKSDNPNVRVYAVSADCTGGSPMTGYLAIPKAAETGKKYGITIKAYGYGTGERFAPKNPDDNVIYFDMNAHGFLLREFGANDEYYKTFGQKVMSNGYTYGFDPVQNSNPETAYFRGMVLRMIRAIEYVKSLPEWNGKDLHVFGRSQGGAFAIWAAGCGEGVTSVDSAITGFCDVGAPTAGRLRGNWPNITVVEALGYFDPVNFAKRIPSTCRVNISRAGLGDYTCQPSSIAILWNNLKCHKTICWMQGGEHIYIPREYEARDTILQGKP